MKNSYIIFTAFLYCFNFPGSEIHAQELDINKIDTSNYYNYNIFRSGNLKLLKGKKIKEGYIFHHEAIPIIASEINKNGSNCQVNVSYKLETGEVVNLDVYDPKRDIGFIYVVIIKGIGTSEARKINSPYREFAEADYVQYTWKKGGVKDDGISIKNLPPNIKILWAEWYWYQSTENNQDDQYLVTKEISEKILRSDVNSLLSHLTSIH